MEGIRNIKAAILAKWSEGLTGLQYIKVIQIILHAEMVFAIIVFLHALSTFGILVFEVFSDETLGLTTDGPRDLNKFKLVAIKIILTLAEAVFGKSICKAHLALKDAFYDIDENMLSDWIVKRSFLVGIVFLGTISYFFVGVSLNIALMMQLNMPLAVLVWSTYSAVAMTAIYVYRKRMVNAGVHPVEGYFLDVWKETFGSELVNKMSNLTAAEQRFIFPKLFRNILVPKARLIKAKIPISARLELVGMVQVV